MATPGRCILTGQFVPGSVSNTMELPRSTSERIVSAAFIIAGGVNLLPVFGALGTHHLFRLYGLPITDPNLLLLLRHRAVLLGLVGGYLVTAAFKPALQPSGFSLGLGSMLSYITLALVSGTGNINPAVMRVFWVDVATSAILGVSYLAAKKS